MSYSPTMMRWVQQDPMGYVDGVSLYGFVTDDPINRQDPTGEKTIVVAFSGLDSPGNPGSKWITQWGPKAKAAGTNVEYRQYTWLQPGKALTETIDELQAQIPVPPGIAEKLPVYGPFGRIDKPECLRNTVVVLAHSFRGNAAHDYVKLLKEKTIKVDAVVTADPRHPPGFPPFDTVPFPKPENAPSWHNFYETQQFLPIELFGAQVTGAINTHMTMLTWDAFAHAHYELPNALDVLSAVKWAVKWAGEYRTQEGAKA